MDHTQVTEPPAATERSLKAQHGTHHVACPGCGKETAIRTHRKGVAEHFASLIGIYPFVCENCKLRFHRFRHSRGSRLQVRMERWTCCPRCGFTEVNPVSKDRVPRSFSNFWCRMVGVPSYRCPECRTKYFSIRPRKKAVPPKP